MKNSPGVIIVNDGAVFSITVRKDRPIALSPIYGYASPPSGLAATTAAAHLRDT
jgi:hypothetical protein